MASDKINILVIDDLHPCFFEQPGMQDFNITYLPNINPSDVPVALVGKQVLVVRSKVFVNKEICNHTNTLQLVARAGSGVDNLDIDWLETKRISFINTPEANSQAVAEHTLGILLSLMANITKADKEVRNLKWDREGNRGDELEGKTIGIIGFGNTGSRFAKVLGGFGVQIFAYDKYKSGFGNRLVKETSMEEIFEKSDIVSLHIPLTAETNNLVNKDFINLFSKPVRLLNLSRGSIVNISDILNALESKKIIGFGADVLQNERLNKLNNLEIAEFEKLRTLSNVVLTPHIGGWTHQSYQKISECLAIKINDFYSHFSHNEKGFKEAQIED
ncbi:MAG: NAD(P)-dependent oxidoreductase, partial [Bacteroidia bacterium]